MDIWMANLPSNEDSRVQFGHRPVIIISNNMANIHSPVVTVVPLTRRIKKRYQPTHVVLYGHGLERRSMVLCEQILTVDKGALMDRLGEVDDIPNQTSIRKALAVQLNL